METKTTFTQAHLENRLWANELEFYHEELNIFDKYAEEVIDANKNGKVPDIAYEAQNQIARFRELVNSLQQDLTHAENKMAMFAKGNETMDLDHVNIADHKQFKKNIEAFKNDYLKFKDHYRTIVAD